jgi:glycosyltransferase involved in cell wall biosynthesis
MNEPPAPKRLTYIVNYLSAGDAQHFVHIPNLLREMEKLGWRIDLVSERGGEGTAEVLGHTVTYVSRSSRTARMVNLARTLVGMRREGGRLVFVRISKFAALASAILGRIFGWKTVYWLSGAVEDFNRRKGARGRLEFVGMWVLFRLIDRLATGPETMVDYYRRLYGLPEGKVLLLYNDVDARNAPAVKAAGTDGEMNLLLVHRLSPVRETDRYFGALIGALENRSRVTGMRVRLDVCGDGPERSLLEQIAKKHAKRSEVHFQGSVPQLELADFYRRAHVFVMPSYREGFPRVMIEAMAHGLPIVATDAGGTRDICGPAQRSFVVDRTDADAFAAAVERLLSSRDERQRLSAENLTTVARFDTPAVARMYDRALGDLIAAESAK